MIKNLDHVTIVVKNLNLAKSFFELFGFKETRTAVISGNIIAAYMHIPNIEADHVTLVLENASPRFEIQLLRYHQPNAIEDPHITELNKVGYNHMCFAVDDIAKEIDYLKKHDVTFINELMEFHDRKLIYLRGPESITIELAEWKKNGHQKPVFS